MKASASDMASLHAMVYGHVQGVFFRAFVQDHAADLGLNGYVRNVRQPAAVEVVAEGKRSALERLLEHLHEGPPGAKVDRVEVRWDDHEGRFADFRTTY